MNRYDRQVRIWGSPAQASLNRAHVCLVAKSFEDDLLQEVLKSLTLAGIGELTLLLEDPKSASEDSGPVGGFFMDSNELFKCGNPTVYISDWGKSFELSGAYQIVVAINLIPGKRLDSLVSMAPEPLLIASANDSFGFVHLGLREIHFITDSRPGYSIPDLRLANAWPELKEFFDSFDLDQWSNAGRLWEIPYPVILYHTIENVKKEYRADLTSQCVRNMIKERFPNNLDDLNIIEAKRFAHTAIRDTPLVNESIQNFLRRPLGELSMDHWFDPLNHEIAYFIRCLRVYFYRYQSLPLRGDLPDMESSSELYGRLKSLYKARCREDVLKFKEIMSEEQGRPSLSYGSEEIFIKRLDCLECLHPNRTDGLNKLRTFYPSGDKCSRPVHLPGKPGKTTRKAAEQQAMDTFHTSCLIGGVASQEIIKLITHQHIPIIEPFIYCHQDPRLRHMYQPPA